MRGTVEIYGVDFSGAAKAGRKTWIAKGAVRNGVLQIDSVARSGAFTGAGDAREECLHGLMAFIGGQADAAFGLDFPFGLPQAVALGHATWEDFILSFPQQYASPHNFRERCYSMVGGRELKRHTDRIQQTPWSPYNLRLYRQSYYGLSAVLAPLVRQGQARVLPMQRPVAGMAWLLEVCPASRLKHLKLQSSYKRAGEAGRAARVAILARLLDTGELWPLPPALRETVLDDQDGDALDSVIAAWVTSGAVIDPAVLLPQLDAVDALEGYVYA
jgi:hypothetical protein